MPATSAPSRLVYDRNRYYDPSAGRFTQEDPAGLSGGLNLYGYAGGDPANNSDPFGLDPDSSKADSTSHGAGAREAEHKAAATCRADAKKFGVSLLMNMSGLGVAKYATSAAKLFRAASALGELTETAWATVSGVFIKQAMYMPAATAASSVIHQGLAAEGTDYHLGGTAGSVYSFFKAMPVSGAGLDLGEAIHSCTGAAKQ